MNNPISKSKYCVLNSKIELASKIFNLFVVKFSMPGVVLPAFLLTIINYFMYNLGNDSYFLSLPIAYV